MFFWPMWVLQTVDVLKLEKFSVWRPSNFGTQVKVCNILNLLIWEFPPLWQILAGNSFHHLRFLNGRSCYLEKLLISEVSELWDKISSAFWTFEIGWAVTCWIINFLQQAYTFSSVYFLGLRCCQSLNTWRFETFKLEKLSGPGNSQLFAGRCFQEFELVKLERLSNAEACNFWQV